MDEYAWRGFRIPKALWDKVHLFRSVRTPTFGGVSGGRTSGLMHILSCIADEDNYAYAGVFANTGKEHEKTLLFLRNIEAATGRTLTWVELEKPPVYGGRPNTAGFRIVDYATANRNGQPFVDFLEMLHEYRAEHKGLGAIVPNAVQRLCTAYMKVKVVHRLAKTVTDSYDYNVGLRADEPDRVRNLQRADTASIHHCTPLYAAGITKQQVLDFWKLQSFDLDIPEYLGNCNKCFLKAVPKLARSVWEEPEDLQWWENVQTRFGSFGFQWPLTALAATNKVRMEVIVPALLAGEAPVCPKDFDNKVFNLIVRQERRYLTTDTSFSCACEAAQGTAELDD